MKINFYNYTGKKNVIQKTLDNPTVKDILLKNDFSEIETSILLKDNISFNYLELPTLKRFYFIKNKTILRTDLIRIDLSLDVLMTYKENILTSKAVIIESENPNINDMTHTTNKTTEVIKYIFPNNPIDYNGNISMACINGSIE